MGDHCVLPALDYTALGCRICEVATTPSARGPNSLMLNTLVNGKCINSPCAFVFVYGLLELRIQQDFKRYLVPPPTWCLNVTSVFSWSHQMASACTPLVPGCSPPIQAAHAIGGQSKLSERSFLTVSLLYLSASVLPSGETEQIYSLFSRKALQTLTASSLEVKSLWSF